MEAGSRSRRTALNGRKISSGFGLLRNSTIFRCANNPDSDSARRRLPKPLEI
jgi:hypothetical protein